MGKKKKGRKNSFVPRDYVKYVADLTRRYRQGEITYEEYVQSVYEGCQGYWLTMFGYYNSKFPSLQPEDIKMAILEAISVVARRVKEHERVFYYISGYIQGFILELAWQLGFPFRIWSNDRDRFTVGEYEFVSIYEEIDDNPKNHETVGDTIIDERDDFQEIEVRDLLDKVLDPLERDVAKLLMDGYTEKEIKEKIGCDCDLAKIKRSIRRKLYKALKA